MDAARPWGRGDEGSRIDTGDATHEAERVELINLTRTNVGASRREVQRGRRLARVRGVPVTRSFYLFATTRDRQRTPSSIPCSIAFFLRCSSS